MSGNQDQLQCRAIFRWETTRVIMARPVRPLVVWAILVLSSMSCHASEVLTDGDFDSLNVATAPDNNADAGRWSIFADSPEEYPEQFSIVPTSSFVPGATGNSLRVDWPETPNDNAHLHRVFQSIPEVEGEIVRATFDVFVPDAKTDTPGGIAVYIGGDHGEGGAGFADRGPQLLWNAQGEIVIRDETPESVLVENTPLDTWQHVQLDIDLSNDSYDMFWSTRDESWDFVAPYRSFRAAAELDFLDRFSVAVFANAPTRPIGEAFLDNVSIKVLSRDWIGDANLDGEFNSGDFVEVFQAGKYETGELAAWSQGDWNSDRVFDSADFVAAFQDGGYEQGPRAVVATVPEPSSWLLLMLGFLGTLRRTNRALRIAPSTACG